jgi:hypothetical protein
MNDMNQTPLNFCDLSVLTLDITTADRYHIIRTKDVKGFLEARCDPGEEIQIVKARLIQSAVRSASDPFTLGLIMMVSDAEIEASSTNQNTNDLDTLVRLQSEGDIEYKVLHLPEMSRFYGDTVGPRHIVQYTVDITKEMRAATKLMYDPKLDPNPEIALCAILQSIADTDINITSSLQVDFIKRARPARSLIN